MASLCFAFSNFLCNSSSCPRPSKGTTPEGFQFSFGLTSDLSLVHLREFMLDIVILNVSVLVSIGTA